MQRLTFGAIGLALAATLAACIPDQSCSNPPHVRHTTNISALSAGATRQNPIELGDVATYGDWQLRVVESSRVADLVHVRIDVEFSGSADGASGDLDDLKFCLAGSLHTLYLDTTDTSDAEAPSPVFGSGYGDEQVRNGWVTFKDVADDDEAFVLAVREAASILARDAGFLYLEVERGIDISRDRSKVRRATASGTEIDSPIPLGDVAVTSAFQIEVTEALLDSEAKEWLRAASVFNPEPREGKTFFLFKVRVTNTASGNAPASISSTQFSADGFVETVATLIAGTNGSGASGSELMQGAAASPWLELPGEKLEATLFQGGTFEGWVLLEVNSDTPPLVIYDPKLGTGIEPDPDRRYFRLASVTSAATEETVRATVVPSSGLNVRSAADPNAAVAYVAPGGSELELTGKAQVVNGVTWWELTDGNWVQQQFLKLS